jgi:tetratricopeptide (TPR) repeat protein
MAHPIEDLVQRWKKNSSPSSTVALCDLLRGPASSILVQEVGQLATERHAQDVTVLVSVARMYLDANRFGDAQTVLVAAGRRSPKDGEIYRWLGEALLRRGDADRAERVLERAIQLGAAGPDPKIWLERARVFRPMQAKAGTRAVAAEVAHVSVPPRELLDSMSENTTDVHLPRPGQLAPSVSPPAQAPPPAAAPARPRFPSAVETAPAFEAAFPLEAAVTFAQADQSSAEIEISVADAPAPLLAPKRVGRPLSPASPLPARMTPAPSAVTAADGAPVPYPRDVMDALAFAGLFEPPGLGAAQAAAWDAAGRGPKRRGAPALIAGMVVFLAASTGIYFFYRHKRAGEHVQAEAILANVEVELHAGKPDALPDVAKELGRAFELESRSPRAALDWARERAMVGLVKSGADVAFEDAMTRAKDLGVPEEKVAFARVASFLFQGDVAGAAAVLPRWDGPAVADPWYQLVAGAVMDRAGDPRARDRYAAATKLDGEIVIARVALARTTAFGDNPAEAMRMAKELRAQMPGRAEPVALVALAWGRDPRREDAPAPPEVDEVAKRGDELPAGLKLVPYATAALRAIEKRAADDARSNVQRGLALAESPGAAVWLGTIALSIGDESLARKAALGALQLSAAYEPARALAARVALLGGRLDEALKATEDLEPASPDVAVVRAATAYERVDADGAARALDALAPDTRKLSFVAALALAGDVLAGKAPDAAKLAALATEDAPWADLVAMDVALDAGDLALADKIAAGWGKASESQALRAIRLARLARYEGRLEAADALTQTAFEQGTVTPRVLWERAFTLVARSRAAEVGPLLSRYPLVLGPLATWLSAYASASSGGVEAAKGKTSAIDPPPAGAPFEVRVVAAAALGAMKDKKRGGDYVKELLATGNLHPDLVAAALSLGFNKVEHGRRRPTYE